MSMKESIKQKKERTDSINKILKGSG
jgi:hypothetical protein